MKSIMIIINGIRLNSKSGSTEYLKSVIYTLTKKFNITKTLVISPSPVLNSKRPGVNIKEIILKVHSNPVINIMLFNIWHAFRILKEIKSIKTNKIEFVLSNSPFTSPIVYIVSKLLGIKSGYIAHNLEFKRYTEQGVFLHELPLVPMLKTVTFLLEFIATRFDIVFSISREDKKKFVEYYRIPPDKVVVIPPKILEDTASTGGVNYEIHSNKNNEICIVFHGSANYIPNREALEFIKKTLLQSVKKYQIVKIVIFGSGILPHRAENLYALGFVDDLYRTLSSCHIAVVPLKRGGGVKIKMLDYLISGLAIVTTKKGAEGLEIVNNKHALILESPNEEFLQNVDYLIENPKLRRKLGYNAKVLAKKKYTMVMS